MAARPAGLPVLHVAFLVAGAGALALPAPASGWAILAVLAAYAVALPLVATGELASIAAFLVPLSAFQLAPDWVLVSELGTLRFPDTGGPRVGDDVPVAMALMWAPPLFVVLAGARGSPARAALLALAVFGAAELLAPVLDLWAPAGDTVRVAGVALYVLPAEAALGWAALVAHGRTRAGGWAERVGAAAAVSTFYLGALVLAHFVID